MATDLPRTPRRGSRATDLALVATFAALIAVCSLVAVTVGAVPVPITLQTFAVLLAGMVLGPRRAVLAVLLYLLVGLAGLPVFAGARGGLGVLAAPSAGYLLSFPLAAAAVAAVVTRVRARGLVASTAVLVGAGVLGILVIYAVGVPVMAWRAEMSLGAAFTFNAAFVPFDAIKLALAAVTGAAVLRAFPALVPRRARPVAVGA